MEVKTFRFSYQEYDDAALLEFSDQQLLKSARKATMYSYSPYSNFRVGAAALLENNEVITASNQENASYPVGICAERVLLSAISATRPQTAVIALAISYHNEKGASNNPISPCGLCRQSLLEYENRFGNKIRIILAGQTGKVIVIPGCHLLLPFSFTADDMQL